MKIFFKKSWGVIKNIYLYYWKKIKNDPINFIFNSIILVSAVVTIVGVFLIKSQAILIKGQLEELNSAARIKIRLHLATTTIQFGPTISEPIDVRLVARNDGNKVTSYWRASLIFCKDINVIGGDSKWIEEGKKQYVFESEKLIPPSFPSKLTFYSDSLDNIGNFKITLPTKNNYHFDSPVPIGVIAISGNYPNPDNYLVSLTSTTTIYEELLDKNGFFDKEEYFPRLKGCFDIIDQT